MKKLNRFLIMVFTVLLLVSGMPISICIDAEGTQGNAAAAIPQADIATTDYYKYSEEMPVSPYLGENLIAEPIFNSEISVLNEYGGEKAFLLDWQSGELSFKVMVSEAAGYRIVLRYMPASDNGLNIKFGLKIDGEYPFDGCERLELARMWVDGDVPRTDSVGNEYSAEQIEYNAYYDKALCDHTGIILSDYVFALSEGEHIVSVEVFSQKLALQSISLTAPDIPCEYSVISESYSVSKNYCGEPVNIEGEDAILKSSRSIVAKSDNSTCSVYPSDPLSSKLNYIGGSTWKSAGERVVWNFTVPESGYYKMGFSFKQSEVLNGSVYRKLYVDGKLPFSEAECIAFNYSTKWQFVEWGNDEPYLVWLEKGEHTLELEVTLGYMAYVYNELKQLLSEIGDLYLKIIMITGESPDMNRDYDLFKQIEGFNDSLEDFKARLDGISEELRSIAGEKTNSNISTVRNMRRVVTSMIENPYTAQVYLSDYYSQYSALGSVISSMVEMPLAIDRIQLCAPDNAFDTAEASLFKQVIFGVKRFIVSFSEDYSRLSVVNDTSGNGIKIWINWGRDQAMVLNSLIQESFTSKTGISVNLELTNASLVKGILSGTQPDLALQLSRSDPVNLAMRNALYDLSEFEDFAEITTRFGSTATEPYKYKDGIYALPDSQSFYCMFYRSDILAKLGLEVPETWDDFFHVASNIARNNMTVYLPYVQIGSATTVNSGIGGLNLFATILQQRGGSVYNRDLNASTLKSAETLSAFRFWTQMYTEYKIPTAQSFYNRFKVGTCPLGIESYTMYTMFSQAAFEIDGCWGIATVPGTVSEDGTVNKTVSGSGTGCVILKKSRNKEEAWEFLKWWTSAETQLSYSNNIESILGAVSRTSPATLEAFELMDWAEGDLEVLKEQQEYIVEVPEIPGSYYLSRAVDQAFWQVIEGTYNAKDALYRWGESADSEIKRKIQEYS